MILKLSLLLFLINLYIYSQQAVLFNTPPGNISLPSVISDENSAPKSSGISIIDSKWIQSGGYAETLLESYSNSNDNGIRKIINEILNNASIGTDLINKLKISFKSSGLEERSINITDVSFSDDFASKYTQDNLFIITKLYRSNNAVIEITETGVSEFNADIRNALSEGLRFGNKTETTLDNKMIIEIQNLPFAYEYQPVKIERLTDAEVIVPVYYDVKIGINSISSMTVTEGLQNELYVKISSENVTKPVEFYITPSNPTAGFRLGGKESYILTYKNLTGNKAAFNLSGFKITFP